MEWQSEEDFQEEKKAAHAAMAPVVARLYFDTNNVFALSDALRELADHVEDSVVAVSREVIEQQAVKDALDGKFNRKVSE